MCHSETARKQPYGAAPAPLVTTNKELVLPSHSQITTDTSKRYLFDHFHRVICRLIVLQESDSGNAFQRLVAPLSLHSEAVAGAIYALACAHLECKGSSKEEMSIIYHNAAIFKLSKVIEQGERANQNELLAAVMLLVYYEVVGKSSVCCEKEKCSLNRLSSYIEGVLVLFRNI